MAAGGERIAVCPICRYVLLTLINKCTRYTGVKMEVNSWRGTKEALKWASLNALWLMYSQPNWQAPNLTFYGYTCGCEIWS